MAPTSPKRPLSPKGSTAQPSKKMKKSSGGATRSDSPLPNAATTTSPTAPSSASPKKKAKQQATASKTTGVMDYLQKSLSRQELLGLYSDPDRGRFVCRSVLQQMSELSQQIVVRLSCTGGVFPTAMVYSWFRGNTAPSLSPTEAAVNHGRMIKLLDQLYQWAIIVDKPSAANHSEKSDEAVATTSTKMVQLTPAFYQGFKDSLHSLDSSPWNPLTETQMDLIEEEAIKLTGKANTKFPRMCNEDLERYTQGQWDAVLHYLVGTGNYADPHPAVAHFLLQTKLMQPDPDHKGKNIDDAPLVITQKGYDFMLQDNSQQVWHFIVQYMASMEENLANDPNKAQALKREALLVLICLSFARFGECYSGAALGKEGRTIIKDLSLFGLLYTKKVGKTFVFYPTRIAMQLVSEGISNGNKASGGGGGGMWSWSSKALESALAHPRPHDSSHLAIIVQTNFQLCAYTTSELHVSMLGLFCDVHTIRRLPNVIFMTISRDSIKGAFNLGIQAQQILRFLEKHAHPKLRESGADPLPGNVVDQIFLWDRERHRIRWNQVFNHQPIMPGEFQAVQKYVMDVGAYCWSSEARNMIMIKYSHVEPVQTFVQKWRAKKASGQL